MTMRSVVCRLQSLSLVLHLEIAESCGELADDSLMPQQCSHVPGHLELSRHERHLRVELTGRYAHGRLVCVGDGHIGTISGAPPDGRRFQGIFAAGCDEHNIDIAGPGGSCGGDGGIDLADILAVLDAFQGASDCCP